MVVDAIVAVAGGIADAVGGAAAAIGAGSAAADVVGGGLLYDAAIGPTLGGATLDSVLAGGATDALAGGSLLYSSPIGPTASGLSLDALTNGAASMGISADTLAANMAGVNPDVLGAFANGTYQYGSGGFGLSDLWGGLSNASKGLSMVNQLSNLMGGGSSGSHQPMYSNVGMNGGVTGTPYTLDPTANYPESGSYTGFSGDPNQYGMSAGQNVFGGTPSSQGISNNSAGVSSSAPSYTSPSFPIVPNTTASVNVQGQSPVPSYLQNDPMQQKVLPSYLTAAKGGYIKGYEGGGDVNDTTADTAAADTAAADTTSTPAQTYTVTPVSASYVNGSVSTTPQANIIANGSSDYSSGYKAPAPVFPTANGGSSYAFPMPAQNNTQRPTGYQPPAQQYAYGPEMQMMNNPYISQAATYQYGPTIANAPLMKPYSLPTFAQDKMTPAGNYMQYMPKPIPAVAQQTAAPTFGSDFQSILNRMRSNG